MVPASLVHVGPIASKMREADRRECEAFGRSPKDALRASLRTSLEAMTALSEDGEPLCMVGIVAADMLSGKATPWLLATDRMLEHKTDLVRIGRRVIGAWLDHFPEMENLVSVENVKAIALLRRWGAEVGKERRVIGGLEFVPFRFAAAIQEERAAA